jgi:protein-disulfide isomerase
VSIEGATVKGDASASVVLIEYSDYRCPYCSRAETDILPEITRRYIDTGRIQLAFRHHPMEQLHPGATKAAEAALCAGRQGRFWQMHSALFNREQGIDEAGLLARARELALDEKSFLTCLAGVVAEQVEADVKEARRLGLTATPAFLVGRRESDGRVRVTAVVNGARPIGDFEKALNQALEAYKRTTSGD